MELVAGSEALENYHRWCKRWRERNSGPGPSFDGSGEMDLGSLHAAAPHPHCDPGQDQLDLQMLNNWKLAFCQTVDHGQSDVLLPDPPESLLR